jgi:hypothetical protein
MIPEFHDEATHRDLLGPAMDIAQRGDAAEAAEFVERYIAHLRRRNPEWTAEQAHQCVMSNVGYFAGYYDSETMRAVREVFGAAHPILGADAPTPEKALEAGKRAALGEFG